MIKSAGKALKYMAIGGAILGVLYLFFTRVVTPFVQWMVKQPDWVTVAFLGACIFVWLTFNIWASDAQGSR